MKILRSVTHRGFNLGMAGWFTVLRPNTWFPASRLPGAHKNFVATAEMTADAARASALNSANGQGRSVQWRVIDPSAQENHVMRSGSILLGALAITSAMLWWIMHP